MVTLSKAGRIKKNFIAIAASYLTLFAAINSTASIQPVLNQDGNLGTTSQMVLFAVNVATSLVIPQAICDLVGFKFALALGEFFQLTYVALQIYPTWYTLIPTSVLAGIGNSLCWAILGMYVTICSKQYAKLRSLDFIKVQTLFFGFLSSLFLLSYVLGPAIVAVVLVNQKQNDTLPDEIYDYANNCGAKNCPLTPLPFSQSNPTKSSVYTLYGILIGLIVLSLFITLGFMDSLKDEDFEGDGDENSGAVSKLIDSFKKEFKNLFALYTNIDVWLLFPLSIYSGYELTYIWFESSRAFATCLLGVNYTGWLNILFGGLGSILCFGMGYLLKYTGVMAGIVFMLMAMFSTQIYILSWTPQVNEAYTIFLMITGFSFSQSVANGQIRGLYGVYFKDNQAAFSQSALGQTLGLFIGSLFSTYTCTNVKSLFYIGLIFTSLICYVTLYTKDVLKKQKQIANLEDNQSKVEFKSLDQTSS